MERIKNVIKTKFKFCLKCYAENCNRLNLIQFYLNAKIFELKLINQFIASQPKSETSSNKY